MKLTNFSLKILAIFLIVSALSGCGLKKPVYYSNVKNILRVS